VPDVTAIYPDGVLMAVLRADPALAGAGVGTLQPADVIDRITGTAGYLVAREVPGGGDTDDRFAQSVSVQIDAYAETRRGARQLAATALASLRRAQQVQTVTDGGSVAFLAVTAYPAELREPDQPDGFSRYVTAAAITVRPPAD
jgi:hypothetical protein